MTANKKGGQRPPFSLQSANYSLPLDNNTLALN